MPSFPSPFRGHALSTRGSRPGSRARVLVVTGASSGIGRSVARQAAAAGDHLVLVARDEASLGEVATECDNAGAASTTVVPTDVGDDQQVARMVARTMDRHGHVDGVAHLAGVVAYGRFDDVPQQVFDGVIRTNLIGSANVARHALRVMRAQQHGSLVLVGSLVGHIGVPSLSPYVVSKWGVRALARELQLESHDVPGVHISYVAPGPASTPIWDQAANYGGWAGHPPPPADRPDKVARVVLERIDHPRDRTQVGIANGLARVTFSALPFVYDRAVSPILRVAMTDFTRRQEPAPGNVLRSHPETHRIDGDHPGPLRRIRRGLGTRAVAAARNAGG
jgi:short-subunit dehydrogenase